MEFLDAFFACGKLGAMLTCFNWRLHWRELGALVQQTTPKAMIFSQEIRSIFEKLYPKHDLRSEPLAFLIADLDYPNAFFTKATHPPAIIITKGMFINPDGTQGIVNSVDRVAAVISHEYEHREFRKDRDATKDTKIEEGRGQWRPVRVLAEAGLDARACYALMSELSAPMTITPEGYLVRVVDPHLSQANNLRLIATAMAALDSEKGGLKIPPTPLTEAKPELVEVAKHVNHKSWCEIHLGQTGVNLLKDSDKWFPNRF